MNNYFEVEDEDECRMCRGPAEEGSPLCKPCICSGSIGFTHQVCLTSWLDVRGGNRCDTCKMEFKFAPRYADDAPDTLPPHEILFGLCRRAAVKWLPFALHVLLVALSWLGGLPLSAAYIYEGWMHKPSSIRSRWETELLLSDAVSGLVVTAIVIIGFLCLMSLADFFRFYWQEDRAAQLDGDELEHQDDVVLQGGPNMPRVQLEPRIIEPPRAPEPIIDPRPDGDILFQNEDEPDRKIDHAAFNRDAVGIMDEGQPIFREQIQPQPDHPYRPHDWGLDLDRDLFEGDIADAPVEPVVDIPVGLRRQRQRDQVQMHILDTVDRNENTENDSFNSCQSRIHSSQSLLHETSDNSRARNVSDCEHYDGNDKDNCDENDDEHDCVKVDDDNEDDDDDDELERMMRMQEEEEILDAQRREGADEIELENHDNVPAIDENDNDGLDPQFEPLNPGFAAEEEPMDEGHVPIDQLIGIRGPISALLRNLFLLLLFITTYLGMFLCLPHAIGTSAFGRFSRITPFVKLTQFIGELFLFPGLAWNKFLFASFRYKSNNEENIQNFEHVIAVFKAKSDGDRSLLQLTDLALIALGYFTISAIVFLLQLCPTIFRRYLSFDMGQENSMNEAQRARNNNEEPPIENWVIKKILLLLECAAAVVKVGILLCMRMFILPLLLGLWLDWSLLELLKSKLEDRIVYAASDIFAFTLLHWVGGISFMLLVTMSVLQLREVIHPNILARIIRPQEPQPDLLGSLLKDSGLTHVKRVTLSLGIYAAALCTNVWLAAKLLVSLGISEYLPFTGTKLWYFLPQLQIPIELLVFHLTLHSILEKYKNRIGEVQHIWLLKMCRLMGMTDHLLPRSIEAFAFVGIIRHYTRKNKMDSFWKDLFVLHEDGGTADQFIQAALQTPASNVCEKTPKYQHGTERNGYRDLCRNPTRICLSKPYCGTQIVLPATIGSYRLQSRPTMDGDTEVEFWREVLGNPVPRPPKDWDDLGAGGAEDQGRWAWGNERKSKIEKSIGQRKRFFAPVFNGDGDQIRSWKNRDVLTSGPIIILKMIALLTLSWLAFLICACGAISTPIIVGRLLCTILRIPDEYMHDPFIFGLGLIISFPTLWKVIVSVLDLSPRSWERWVVTSFILGLHWRRTPPWGKIWVFTLSCLLWFVISPLLLGMIYELLFVTPYHSLPNGSQLLLVWVTGLTLLHFWAAMCYFGIFCRKFWVDIGVLDIGLIDVDRNVEEVQNAKNDGVESAPTHGWQGSEGVISRFARIFSSVIFHSEWDKVDRVALLDESTIPLTRQLLLTLLGPTVTYFTFFFAIRVFRQNRQLLPKGTYSNFYKMIVYDIFTIVVVLLQLIAKFRSKLQNWFVAVHNAARDDRYLIGVILLDYVTPVRRI